MAKPQATEGVAPEVPCSMDAIASYHVRSVLYVQVNSVNMMPIAALIVSRSRMRLLSDRRGPIDIKIARKAPQSDLGGHHFAWHGRNQCFGHFEGGLVYCAYPGHCTHRHRNARWRKRNGADQTTIEGTAIGLPGGYMGAYHRRHYCQSNRAWLCRPFGLGKLLE